MIEKAIGGILVSITISVFIILAKDSFWATLKGSVIDRTITLLLILVILFMVGLVLMAL